MMPEISTNVVSHRCPDWILQAPELGMVCIRTSDQTWNLHVPSPETEPGYAITLQPAKRRWPGLT